MINGETVSLLKDSIHFPREKQETQQPHISQVKAEDPAILNFTRVGLKVVSHCHLNPL